MTPILPDPLAQALTWWAAGRKVALATVIDTRGSAPRPVGSQMAVDEHGAMAGSVSGGCVEGAVVHEALKCIADGEPRLLTFGITDEMAWDVGLPCGGRIEIYLEALAGGFGTQRKRLQRLQAIRAEGRPVALLTDLTTGLQALIDDDDTYGSLGLLPDQLALVRQRLAADHSGIVVMRAAGADNGSDNDNGNGNGNEEDDEDPPRVFVHVFAPPPRLFIVGAVHIAQALLPMAEAAGYAVSVIDPRDSFASAERFPGVVIDRRWPDEALSDPAPDARTAVVTLTHDPKLDDPALMAALRSPAFYVGALGSRHNQAVRCRRLTEQGVSAADIARVHGPVGLAIGARSPAEIAVAILAELTAVRRGRRFARDPLSL
jgi:xanthine dehydrogenase accessory factor